ncbi:MAG: 3-methyl-2-oxobutanoate dehydrogenase subunit beta [Candidatus Coatesbacteria bacterium]|nr:MAG: 3-methyl-2-oxobutanoate dehydrogenase subunit beta [Candidatus Coatesbacteria bacterium]
MAEKKEKKKKLTVPEEELMYSGHLACQGCGATIAMRYALKALGPKTSFAIPACCWSVIDGPFPYTSLGIPIFHTAFETAAVMASGLKAGFDIMGKTDVTSVAWGGDGGTTDIGIQALSGAAERNDDILYICYDNEAYMNTGVQRSSQTPWGAWTTTTPARHFKKLPKKNMVDIMAAHGIPYIATSAMAFPEDIVKKVSKAKDIKGCKYVQILASCPPGWKMVPEKSIEVIRLAVNTRIWPMLEIEEGVYNITRKPRKEIPVADYLKLQGRFRHLTEDQVNEIQEIVNFNWQRLRWLEESTQEMKEKYGRATLSVPAG